MNKDNILEIFNSKFVNIVTYKEMIANIRTIYFTVLKYVVKYNTSYIINISSKKTRFVTGKLKN